MEDIDNNNDHEIEDHDHEYDLFLNEVVQDDHELLYLDSYLKDIFGS